MTLDYDKYPAKGEPYPAPAPHAGEIAVWTWDKNETPEIVKSRTDGLPWPDSPTTSFLKTGVGDVKWYEGEGFYVPTNYLKKDGTLKAAKR